MTLATNVKKYIQPLRYTIEKEELKAFNILTILLPDQWAKAINQLEYPESPRMKGILEMIRTEYPEILHSDLSPHAKAQRIPFLYMIDDEKSRALLPDMMEKIYQEMVEDAEYERMIPDYMAYQSLKKEMHIESQTAYDLVHTSQIQYQLIPALLSYLTVQKPLELSEGRARAFTRVVSVNEDQKMIVSQPYRTKSNYIYSHAVRFSVEIPLHAYENDELVIHLHLSTSYWPVSDEPISYGNFTKYFSLYAGSFSDDGSTVLYGSKVKSHSSKTHLEVKPGQEYYLKKHNIIPEGVLSNLRKYCEKGVDMESGFAGISLSQENRSWFKGKLDQKKIPTGMTPKESEQFYEAFGLHIPLLQATEQWFEVPKKDDDSSAVMTSINPSDKNYFPNFKDYYLPEHVTDISLNLYVPKGNKWADRFMEHYLEYYSDKYTFFRKITDSEWEIKFSNRSVRMNVNKIETVYAYMHKSEGENKTEAVLGELSQHMISDSGCLNIFFLADYHNQKGRDGVKYVRLDPKKDIRQAFSNHNCHVQFMNYPLKSPDHFEFNKETRSRMNNSFLDILSKHGITRAVTNQVATVFGVSIQSDGSIYFSKRTPEGECYFSIPGKPWLSPYESVSVISDTSQKSYSKALQFLAKEITLINGPVQLCFNGGKLRIMDDHFKNGRMFQDTHQLQKAFSKVSIVRINTGRDVPDHYARSFRRKRKDTNGERVWNVSLLRGLYSQTSQKGVYYSIAARGDANQYSPSQQRDTYHKSVFKRSRIVEFAIQSSDTPTERIAHNLHTLRNVNIAFGKETNLPSPLNDLEKMLKDFK